MNDISPRLRPDCAALLGLNTVTGGNLPLPLVPSLLEMIESVDISSMLSEMATSFARTYFFDRIYCTNLSYFSFLNTILPSRTLPLKPSSSNSSSNISRFLTNLQTHFQADSSTEHIPAFLPDDLGPSPSHPPPAQLQAYWDGLKRVANCIIAIGHLRESQLQSQSRQQASSPTPGIRAGIYQRHAAGSISTPDLTIGRTQSPPLSPTKAKRFSPPSPPSKAVQSSLEQGDRGKGRLKDNQIELPSPDGITNRTSVSTNATSATYLSSLFTSTDRNYGTVRTMATDLTSTSGATSSKADENEDIVRRRRRVSEVGMPVDLDPVAEAEVEGGGTIEIKVKVLENGRNNSSEDRAGKIISKKEKIAHISPINIHLGKGKWPDDFMDVFSPSPPVSPKNKSEFPEKGKMPDEDTDHGASDTDEPRPARSAPIPIPAPLTPRKEFVSSSPSGSPRRPLRLRRPSAGSPSPASSAFRSQSPSGRDGSPTPFACRVPNAPPNSSTVARSSSPAVFLPRQMGTTSPSKDSSSPSKASHASSLGMEGVTPPPMLMGRRYSANASIPTAPMAQLKTMGKYAPKSSESKRTQEPHDTPGQSESTTSDAAVPFPRRSSGEYQRHSHQPHPSVTILPALLSSTETLTSSHQSLEQSIDSLASDKPTRHQLTRGRFQSEDLAGAETLRIRAARAVEEEIKNAQQQTRPRARGRTESMVNLGTEQSVGSMIRDRTGANSAGPRLTVTIKEDGQQVHYVSILIRCQFIARLIDMRAATW